MKDFKAAKNLYIPLENVELYVAYGPKAVISDVRKHRQEGKVLDYTCGKKTNSVVYLKSGMMILLNTTVDTINTRRLEGKEEIG